MGSSHFILVVIDSLCRRVLMPLALLSAVLVRFNLFSLIYLLFLVVGVVLPSPRLKTQKVSSFIYLLILLLTSLVFLLGQAFFQISLIQENLDPCDNPETVLRQIGLVQFTIPVSDVLRLLLPDAVVLLSTAVTLIVDLKLVRVQTKVTTDGGSGSASPEVTEEVGVAAAADSGREGSDDDGGGSPPPVPSSVQSYWQIPGLVNVSLDLLIFVLLGLAGIMVPSLTSLVYYLSFLFLLGVWSLHMKAAIVVRTLRVFLVFYCTLHLVVLDLYQFQSAQYHVPLNPNTTSTSLLARLFGLTPLVRTDCQYPTRLLSSGVLYTNYISPSLLLLLVLCLATDLRLWLFTPVSAGFSGCCCFCCCCLHL